MFKNLKLTTKFFLTFFLVAIIPFSIIMNWNYFVTRSELISITINSLRAVNTSQASHINNMVLLRQEQTRQLAASSLLKRLSSDGNNSDQIRLEINDYLNTIHAELKQAPESGYAYIDKKSDIEIIAVFDAKGKMVAQTHREIHEGKLEEKISNVHFNEIRKKGTYFGGLYGDSSTGKNYFFFNEEILNMDDKLYAGNVTLMVNADIINQITTVREGLGETGETYIVNKRLMMITQSRFVENAPLRQPVRTEVTKACFEGRQIAHAYPNYRGIFVLGAQQYLPDQQWCLVSEIERVEAFAPVTRLLNQTELFAILVIMCLLFFALYFSRLFIKPILSLNSASRMIADGNYNVTTLKSANDEIGELSDTFNSMAQKLADAKNQLEQKNKILEKNLTLIQSQKGDIEKVNKELDHYVYTINHDIRSPLMGVLGYTSLLREKIKKKLNEKEKIYFTGILKSVKNMNNMIDDLFSATKIKYIKNPYKEINCNDLIDRALERLDYQIKRSNVDVDVQKNLPNIICDQIKLGEVFFNLISNAIKFSIKNIKTQPKIEIRYQDKDNVHQFSIKDSGIGIDAQYHDKIFEMFMSVADPKEYDSKGVGLSIVKECINNHCGRVWVDSQHGEGATFYFTISKNLNY